MNSGEIITRSKVISLSAFGGGGRAGNKSQFQRAMERSHGKVQRGSSVECELHSPSLRHVTIRRGDPHCGM